MNTAKNAVNAKKAAKPSRKKAAKPSRKKAAKPSGWKAAKSSRKKAAKSSRKKAAKPSRKKAAKPSGKKTKNNREVRATPKVKKCVNGGSQKPKKVFKNAYCTTIFGGDSYVQGAAILGHSLRLTGSTHDMICFVTPDVSEDARIALAIIYTEVKEMEYLDFETKPLATDKQNIIYKWRNKSFTKWVCMSYEKYDKLCFLDADLIITQNIDDLFKLRTPAAPFINLWVQSNPYSKKYIDYYKRVANKGLIPAGIVKSALRNGFMFNGHLVVLKPNAKEFEEFTEMVESMQPFGIGRNISMHDEQALSNFYSVVKKRSWIKLDHTYNYVMWHLKKIHKIIGEKILPKPKIVHFMMTEKPWMMTRYEWKDIDMWWQIAKDMVSSKLYPKKSEMSKLRSLFDEEQLDLPAQSDCPYCITVEEHLSELARGPDNHDHLFVTDGAYSCHRL
jgi:alpha-N-acetylglucosamine transferase